MADGRWQESHLSDDEIDAYWTRRLEDEDEQRIEEHYLECAACQARVRAVEDLINGLRVAPASAEAAESRGSRAQYMRIAAALMVSAGLIAGWQWTRRALPATLENTGLEGAGTAAPHVDPGAGRMMIVRLTPPTRDAGVPVVTIDDASAIMFVLDAREAGADGSPFAVSLIGPRARVILHVSSLQSSSAGELHVPVDRTLVAPGQYVFEVGTGTSAVTFPFVLKR